MDGFFRVVEMQTLKWPVVVLTVLLLAWPGRATPAGPAAGLAPEVKQVLDRLFGGDFSGAAAAAREMATQQPWDPLPVLLEAEARWWSIYCEASSIQWGMVDAWKRSRQPGDDAYLALTRRAITLADAPGSGLAPARAHLYAGLGYALQARLYGLRDERMPTARAGVRAREEFLRALALDPQLADAYTGLGLYNYYVDTLSPLVKLLRFFLGIPGGSKRDGIRQLRIAMERGELTAVEARFYLAKNLRTYDHQYAEALTILTPLLDRYPQNLIFRLLAANLDLELGRREQAKSQLQNVLSGQMPDAACTRRLQALAQSLLSSAR